MICSCKNFHSAGPSALFTIEDIGGRGGEFSSFDIGNKYTFRKRWFSEYQKEGHVRVGKSLVPIKVMKQLLNRKAEDE